jgi:hypothetical protein
VQHVCHTRTEPASLRSSRKRGSVADRLAYLSGGEQASGAAGSQLGGDHPSAYYPQQRTPEGKGRAGRARRAETDDGSGLGGLSAMGTLPLPGLPSAPGMAGFGGFLPPVSVSALGGSSVSPLSARAANARGGLSAAAAQRVSMRTRRRKPTPERAAGPGYGGGGGVGGGFVPPGGSSAVQHQTLLMRSLLGVSPLTGLAASMNDPALLAVANQASMEAALHHCLASRRFRRWAHAEWHYSAIDRPFFMRCVSAYEGRKFHATICEWSAVFALDEPKR